MLDKRANIDDRQCDYGDETKHDPVLRKPEFRGVGTEEPVVGYGAPHYTMPFTAAPDCKVTIGTSQERKETPIASGVLDYFPLALAAVARLSKWGNDKHNPGEPLHWSRGKSNDHRDCIARHLIACGQIDPESGELHDVALAWRALANLQLAEEKRLGLTPKA